MSNKVNRITQSLEKINGCLVANKPGNFKNVADDYLPIGPTTIEKQALSWSYVYKSIIENSFNLESELDTWDEVKSSLNEHFTNSRETRDLAGLINDIYLNAEGLKSITPLAYLICADSPQARTRTMSNIFSSLINNSFKNGHENKENNLLEKLVIEAFENTCKKQQSEDKSDCYLPFLSDTFSKDIETLKSSTGWFVDEFENLIALYSFLYLAQLSISIGMPRVRFDKPSSQRLFFILENERASKERFECNTHGYNSLFSKTNGYAKKTFPYLGYLNSVTDKPAWKFFQENGNSQLDELNILNKKTAELFSEPHQESDDIRDLLTQGFEMQLRILMKTDRKSANDKVFNVFHDVFARSFITDRKAAGMYFTLKSNTLMLLTNLVIGKGNKLLIDDVVDAFRERGIWFDLQSKKSLLKFYENVGNIEKLSDSGDAVYVKSTI